MLEAADVAPWVRETLLNPGREKPVVAVTTRPRTGSTWLEPKELAAALGESADVVCLETGDPTWELSEALPARLDVYGGALRVWWPGLRADSDPYDHRLFFIHSAPQARAVFDEIVTAIRGPAARQPTPTAEPVAATVQRVSGTRIELAAGSSVGDLRHADVPLAELARSLEVGTQLRARVLSTSDGRVEFSCRGLLPSPWLIARESLAVGDVVTGRVQSLRDFGAFVDVLPQVTGLVHISELDWTFVDSVAEFVNPGQVVAVKIMAMDADAQKLELSVKRAFGSHPKPLPSLVPDGVPFSWPLDEGQASSQESAGELRERVTSLTDELDAAVADRGQLTEANKTLREQVQDLRLRLKSAEDRTRTMEQRLAQELDPLGSERGFLLRVRLTYARMFDEGSRQDYVLQKMRVGPAFLVSLRALDGVELEKVLEVAAQVAAGMAHEVEGRDVHQLRDGSRGSGNRVRAKDNATAWRCALQVKTPSARRLHWWAVPGAAGPTIEFANVVLHDEFSIPE